MPDRHFHEQLLLLREEAMRRQSEDSWWKWAPTTRQLPFIKAILQEDAEECWFLAANRCITPWTVLETGSSTRQCQELIGETGFCVRSWDGGSLCTRSASPLFLKGIEPAFRLLLDNGSTFEATRRHQVLTPVGWFSLESLMSMPDDPCWTEKAECWQANCDEGGRRYDRPLRIRPGSDTAALPPAVCALIHSLLAAGPADVTVPTLECIRACLRSFRSAMPDDPHRLADLCALWKAPSRHTNDQCWYGLHQGYSQLESGFDPAPTRLESPCPDLEGMQGVVYVLSPPILLANGVKLLAYQEIGLHPILDFTVDGTHCYIAGGAVHHNSGKTDAAAFAGASLARFGRKCPRYQITDGGAMVIEDYATSGWVVSQDFPNSRDVVQPKFFDNGFGRDPSHPPFIPERELEGGSVERAWSVTNQILRLRNNSIIGFKSADSGQFKFAGPAKDWVLFDEEPPKPVYEECTMRVAGGRKLQLFGACTLLPKEGESGGVSWLFPDRIKPWKMGKEVPWRIFGSSIYDNPHIPQGEIDRMEALYPEGSAQRSIRLYGELIPGLSGARAYPSFDARVHVRDQGLVVPRRPLCWCWDFNVEPLITLVGQRIAGNFHVYQEIVMDEGSIGEMCEAFRDVYPEHHGEVWVYGDATGRHRDVQSRQSEYRLIFNNMMRYGSPVRMKVPEQNPPVTARINAIQYQLRDVEGVSHIEIDPSCDELIADMEGVLLDARGTIKKVHNRRDPYSRRTHSSDALGYWIAYDEPVKLIQKRNEDVQSIRSPKYAFSAGRR